MKTLKSRHIAKYIQGHVFWDWTDFGVMFKVYKCTGLAQYHVALDIQVLWLNLWVCFLEREYKYKRSGNPFDSI